MQAKQNRGVRGTGGTYGSMTKRFDGKEDNAEADKEKEVVTTGNVEEDKRIQEMLAQQGEMWERELEDMSQ